MPIRSRESTPSCYQHNLMQHIKRDPSGHVFLQVSKNYEIVTIKSSFFGKLQVKYRHFWGKLQVKSGLFWGKLQVNDSCSCKKTKSKYLIHSETLSEQSVLLDQLVICL